MTLRTTRKAQIDREQANALGSATVEHRRVLLTLADGLRPHLTAKAVSRLDSITHSLAAKGIRVGVTGSVQTGFPRLANALAGRPHLLPPIAPAKTATVARLCFQDDHGGSSALFRFFDHPAWQAIITGGGRLRSDLDDKARAIWLDRLDIEVEEMRTRAYMRLGDEYHKMLGTEHRVDELTAPVAARYLGSDEVPGSGRPARARFADMTRDAEVYLPQMPFAAAASLIVTPGFDPNFQVREERTAEALEACDLAIVVISADEPMNAETRAMLARLIGRLDDRLVVVLDTAPESDARVDREILRDVVAGFCSDQLKGREVRTVLVSSALAERGLLAQSGATHGDPRALMDAANMGGLVRAIEEAYFWGPGLSVNEAATNGLLVLAESELDTLARKIGLIHDRRRRFRSGEQDADEAELRARARTAIEDTEQEATSRIEAHLSALWGKARTSGLRVLRSRAEEAASGQLTGAGASPAMRNARAPLALALTESFRDRLEEDRDDIIRLLDEERETLLGILAEAEATEDLPEALITPVALSLDLNVLMMPIEEAGLHEPSLDRTLRMDEAQRRLMVPYQTVVEKMAEDATLALGKLAREKLMSTVEAARVRLEQQTDAANKANELTDLISRHAAIETVVTQLGAFKSASARGARPLGPDAELSTR
ncbi:MAG: hypothetical protein AAGC57_04320 [Pseudomonadota bacterium]